MLTVSVKAFLIKRRKKVRVGSIKDIENETKCNAVNRNKRTDSRLFKRKRRSVKNLLASLDSAQMSELIIIQEGFAFK